MFAIQNLTTLLRLDNNSSETVPSSEPENGTELAEEAPPTHRPAGEQVQQELDNGSTNETTTMEALVDPIKPPAPEIIATATERTDDDDSTAAISESSSSSSHASAPSDGVVATDLSEDDHELLKENTRLVAKQRQEDAVAVQSGTKTVHEAEETAEAQAMKKAVEDAADTAKAEKAEEEATARAEEETIASALEEEEEKAKKKAEEEAAAEAEAKRKTEEEEAANAKAEEEAKVAAEAEAKKKAEEEAAAKAKAEEEAKAVAEAEAKRKTEEEEEAAAKAKVEEEAKAAAEAEAKKQAEEEAAAKAKAEEEAKVAAEAEAKKKAEEEAAAKAKAEEEAKEKAEAEAKEKAEEEAAAKAKAEEEAKVAAEAEAKKKAEEEAAAKAKAEEEAKEKAEAEAKEKAEAEAKEKAEEEAAAKVKAKEEAKVAAEAEAKRKTEEEEGAAAKAKAEEEVKAAAEAEAKRKTEEEVEAAAKAKAEEEAKVVDEATQMKAKEEVMTTADAKKKANKEAAVIARAEADVRKVNEQAKQYEKEEGSDEKNSHLPSPPSASGEVGTQPMTFAQRMKDMFDSSSPDQPSNAFGNKNHDNASRKSETQSSKLAKRMKDMFDSQSPDQPSNAFGKHSTSAPEARMLDLGMEEYKVRGLPPTTTCLANDMKKMFDSPSLDSPSKAFGAGKGTFPRRSDSLIQGVDIQSKTNPSTPMKDSTVKIRTTESKSPTSVADQMVSLLWASSTPTKRSLSSSLQDYNGIEKENCAVIRDTVMEEEDEIEESVEEITVEDETDDHPIPCSTVDVEYELIEEIIIEDDHKDGISMTTADDFVQGTARIEVSSDFVNMVAEAEKDGRSYDEITADDWEYDEKTIGDESEILQNENQKEDGANSVVNHVTKSINEPGVSTKNTRHDILVSSDKELQESMHLPTTNSRKKATSDIKTFSIPKEDAKVKQETSSIPLATPEMGKRTSPKAIKAQENHPSRVGKLNPRLVKDQSTIGTLAEKLKMFDSPNIVPNDEKVSTFQQTWRKSKPLIKPSSGSVPIEEAKKDIGCNSVVLSVAHLEETKQSNNLNSKSSSVSSCSEQDDALVKCIISLVKEPGAMQNKHGLAARITSLLTRKSNEATEVVAPQHFSSDLAPSKIAERPMLKKKIMQEADAYASRKIEGFQDPGLKQMRNDVELQKVKLRHVDDPDSIQNRTMKRSNVKPQKEGAVKSVFIEPTSDTSRKAMDAEEIIARIWPKTPDGKKRNPKASLSSNRSSKTVTFERATMTPRKLGERLKMFEASPSPSSSIVPQQAQDSIRSNPTIRTPKTSNKKVFSEKTVSAEYKAISDKSSRNEIGTKTTRGLLSFQRLWRKSKLKRVSTSKTRQRTMAKSQKSDFVSERGVLPPGSNTIVSDHRPGSIASDPILPSTAISLSSSPVQNSVGVHSAVGCGKVGTVDIGRYRLEDLEQGRFDPDVLDMNRWEEFLFDDEFCKHFDLTKDEFYQQPKWKREKQKRRIRVAF